MAVSRNSRIYCGVFGCNTFYSTNENISFHLLPNEYDPKVLWINKMGKEELDNRRCVWAMNLRFGKETLKKHNFVYVHSTSLKTTLCLQVIFSDQYYMLTKLIWY